jgi:SAM-dependent methyltransferase
MDSEYNLYQCNHCLCRFFNHEEHDVDYKAFYQQLSQNHQATFNPVFKKKKSWIDLKKNLIQILGKNPKSIMDVGCRTGDFLMHFDEQVQREGVELAEDYASIAKERGLKIYIDFLENITFEKKYDIVSCLAILEHLIEPQKFLNTINDLVKSQGILVIMIPSFECLKEKLLNVRNKRWHMYRPPEHLNFFSKHYLDEFMTKNSFDLVKREFTSGGMVNPFTSVEFLRKAFGRIIYNFDRSLFNRIPVFDHMYSIYRKQ